MKLALVALSGVGAALHQAGGSRAALAAWGALALVASAMAMLLGILHE